MENNNAVSVDADINEMRAHLRKAVKTLKTQPYRNGDKPRGVISSWVLVDASDRGLGDNIPRHKQIKSTPKQISHMHYWVDQMLTLDEESRRIVMARAAGIAWRRLEEIDGRSHTTLRKVEKAALISMLGKIKEGRGILPKDFIA